LGDLEIVLPPVPQSLWAIETAHAIPALGFTAAYLLGSYFRYFPVDFYPPARNPLVISTFVLAFSYLGYFLFARANRIQSALETQASIQPSPERTNRQLLIRTLIACTIILAGNALMKWPFRIEFSFNSIVTFLTLIPIVALILDWRDSFRFHKGGPATCLIEMDNVYLARLFRARLLRKQIPSTCDTERYRSLYFLTQPAVKMRIWVRLEDYARARELINAESIHRL
jgi:hypothetical protein